MVFMCKPTFIRSPIRYILLDKATTAFSDTFNFFIIGY